MIVAVSRARRRSDDQIRTRGPEPIVVASAAAMARAPVRPSSLSGGSARPCQRRSRFHVDSPWRTQSTWAAIRPL